MRTGRWVAVLAFAVGIPSLSASPGLGADRVVMTKETFPPVYARVLSGNPEWVPIYFYRDLGCVRQDFNLLDFFDLGNIPGIFQCDLTVEGFGIFEDYESGLPPFQSKFKGDEVPVFFVHPSELADGQLDLSELLDLVEDGYAMRGTATFFRETLQPSADPFPAGGAKVPLFAFLLKGTLEEGGPFLGPFRVHVIAMIPPYAAGPFPIVRVFDVRLPE